MQYAMEIRFVFEGYEYVTDQNAYYTDYIKLPDGRILRVNSWLERNPPIPESLSEVKTGTAERV